MGVRHGEASLADDGGVRLESQTIEHRILRIRRNDDGITSISESQIREDRISYIRVVCVVVGPDQEIDAVAPVEGRSRPCALKTKVQTSAFHDPDEFKTA